MVGPGEWAGDASKIGSTPCAQCLGDLVKFTGQTIGTRGAGAAIHYRHRAGTDKDLEYRDGERVSPMSWEKLLPMYPGRTQEVPAQSWCGGNAQTKLAETEGFEPSMSY